MAGPALRLAFRDCSPGSGNSGFGCNTPTTNVYNSATNRDGCWSYDSAGNLTTVNGNTATCNAEDQLTSLTATNGATENLYYEALGTRVKKVISGTGGSTTVYVSDAFGLEAEYVGGTWAKDYIANGSGQLVATENALSPAQLVLRRQTTSAASA